MWDGRDGRYGGRREVESEDSKERDWNSLRWVGGGEFWVNRTSDVCHSKSKQGKAPGNPVAAIVQRLISCGTGSVAKKKIG